MKTIERNRLLADLWWLKYQQATRNAQIAFQLEDDKLKILYLTILAHKAKCEYEYYANVLI